MLTCLCAKLGRNERKSKPQGEKCVTVHRFFVRIKVELSKQVRKKPGREHEVSERFYRKTRREKKKDGSDKVNCLSRLGALRVCFRVVPK